MTLGGHNLGCQIGCAIVHADGIALASQEIDRLKKELAESQAELARLNGIFVPMENKIAQYWDELKESRAQVAQKDNLLKESEARHEVPSQTERANRLIERQESLEQEVEKLEAQVATLRAGLEKYGNHRFACVAINPKQRTGDMNECDCGFNQALAALDRWKL